ncbi:hypothetical protein Tco_0924721 [Tanacetum coccineum]|uniref:Uncharacterized protein n=1 Tax=Tanacetum coccineum TaxID=301880 RepID=A0ABQ5D5S1_9ASTR
MEPSAVLECSLCPLWVCVWNVFRTVTLRKGSGVESEGFVVRRGTKSMLQTERGQEDVAERISLLELADPIRVTKPCLLLPLLPLLLKKVKVFVDLSAQASLQIRTTVGSSSTLSAPVDTAVATTTFTKAKLVADVNPDLAGPSQFESQKGSDAFSMSLATLDPSERSVADDKLSLGQREVPFGARVGALRKSQCVSMLHVVSLFGEENNPEILWLKSQLRDRRLKPRRLSVDSVTKFLHYPGRRSTISAEGQLSKINITQKDHDIPCLTTIRSKITSLASERDRLVSEVSSLRAGFEDFKEKMEIQQEEQAHELYNRVAELEAHMIDVSGHLEGELLSHLTTGLYGRKRWLLTHEIKLALLKCLKFSEYQGILGHALGWAVDFGMQEGLQEACPMTWGWPEESFRIVVDAV